MKKSKIKNQKSKILGQTILELLVALTLIMLFLSGVVIIQLVSIRNVQYAQRKSIATKLAREQIERARVVRDSAGIDALAVCISTCFINNQLTPVPVTPTGIYGQTLRIQPATSADCPLPDITITPVPVSYKAISSVSWAQGTTGITPAPELSISSCITDWR